MKKYSNASELKEPGYYWWLAPNLNAQKHIKKNWRIIAWHPHTAVQKDGTFVGPIPEPIEDAE